MDFKKLLGDETYKALKSKIAEEGKTMQEVVKSLILKYLNKTPYNPYYGKIVSIVNQNSKGVSIRFISEKLGLGRRKTVQLINSLEKKRVIEVLELGVGMPHLVKKGPNFKLYRKLIKKSSKSKK